jgi:hypothetical protein
MDNEAFADVKTEGTDPFEQFDKERETPAESQPETKQEEVKADEEDNTPFHLRWKEREAKLKEDFEQQLNEVRREVDEKVQKLEPRNENIPDWFTELYGANEVAWQKYSERESQREIEIEQRVLAKQEEKRQAETQEVQKWENWVNEQVKSLESEGLKFDKNELIKTVMDYRPTDENNNFDFKAGYKIMEALKAKDPAVSHARKQIADTMTQSKTGEQPKKDFMTAQQLRNLSWGSL